MRDDEFMTEAGRACYARVKLYGLDKYYHEHTGAVIIPTSELYADSMFGPVNEIVLDFLRDNPEWIMGFERAYEGCPESDCYYFLQTSEAYKNW